MISWNRSLPNNNEGQFDHCSQVSKFVFHVQTDCQNEKNEEVVYIKTRAVAPIKCDLSNWLAFLSHGLKYLKGLSDSYEQEFYDTVCIVLLKHALQLRIGQMSNDTFADRWES